MLTRVVAVNYILKNYPDIFKDLVYAKNRFYENSLPGIVRIKPDNTNQRDSASPQKLL